MTVKTQTTITTQWHQKAARSLCEHHWHCQLSSTSGTKSNGRNSREESSGEVLRSSAEVPSLEPTMMVKCKVPNKNMTLVETPGAAPKRNGNKNTSYNIGIRMWARVACPSTFRRLHRQCKIACCIVMVQVLVICCVICRVILLCRKPSWLVRPALFCRHGKHSPVGTLQLLSGA